MTLILSTATPIINNKLLITNPLFFPAKSLNPINKLSKFSTSLHVSTPLTPPSFTTTPKEEENEETSSSSTKFSWRDNWYPVSLIEDLDTKLPTPFQLLNREIVLWKDRVSGDWVAFDDKCPHRLAPLSEGRIDEDGNLQCSYHGWSFSKGGSCVKIPQANSDGPEARAVNSPRACVTKFPTLVSQGLLFVWPDENGWEKASATKPPMLPEDFDSPEFSTVTIQRDLFYGYDTLMENVSDPSHIDFAHHKVTGRRDRAKPLPFKLESSGALGFAGSNDGNPRITAEFIAPCYYINKIEIDTKLPIFGEQKWAIWICSFNIPMAPGKTRSIVCSARNFFQFTMPGPAWWQVFPRWQEHWTSNKVYDGDMIVLQGQEKTFLSKSLETSADVNEQYSKITFTPTQADRFVLAFRNWLRRHGNNQPEWFGVANQQQLLPSTTFTKRQMLDRFEQHTLKCSSCKGAYGAFQTLQKVLLGATVIFAATAGIPSDLKLRLVLSGLALASAALAYAVHELEKNFVYVDYICTESFVCTGNGSIVLKIGLVKDERYAMEDEGGSDVLDNSFKQMTIGKPPRDPLGMRHCVSSNRLVDGSESDSEIEFRGLKSPSDGKHFLPIFRSGSWSEIGPKSYMEDEHICVDNLHKHLGAFADFPSPGAFYGVFDGHNGSDAALFTQKHILKFIVEDSHFSTNVKKAIKSGFIKADHAFADACSLDNSSGTTVLTALIFGRNMVVANAGDCRAVLGKRGRAVELSKDHKPNCTSEKLRIERLGGIIYDGYLNGQLSVARALGDWHIKGSKASICPLSAEPELKETYLTEEDEFLILACDGLWDVMSSQCAVTIVRKELMLHNDPQRCSKELVREALKRNSCDNLTAVVICFSPDPPPKIEIPKTRWRRSVSADGINYLKGFLDNA
ncbi:hypothetical protein IFM89_028812 [Coptis chinensis]|uniref:protein-serine/threonine phosphatase n=1 Tax=Coptis chinensis TaxID=261450 RepID=A0A835H5Z3_9MAGN|nr:hypothetical protein IFM89_028812 [Coptis chinensis]